MELPKNITQIGESDRYCRVYAEDYVVSYLKQLNRQCSARNTAVALYGIRKEEDGVSYVFFYGAAKINSMLKEVRHLSQAQNQEIEKIRKRFFPDHQFLGYGILNGEMVEGFYVCEQGVCRYINGYACFYEKNDRMLAYMLDSRREEAPVEVVEHEKYDAVRKRQEERRAQYRESIEGSAGRKVSEDEAAERRRDRTREGTRERTEEAPWVTRHSDRRKTTSGSIVRSGIGSSVRSSIGRSTAGRSNTAGNRASSVSLRMMKTAAVGMFLLLCVLGIAALNDLGDVKDIQAAARQLIAQFAEQKLPDERNMNGEAVGGEQKDTLVTQDKLTEVIIEENNVSRQTEESEGKETEANSSSGEAVQPSQQAGPLQPTQSSQPTQPSQPSQPSQSSQAAQPSQPSQPVQSPQPSQPSQSSQPAQSSEAAKPSQEASAPVTYTSYTIRKGDTLSAISVRHYGTDARVKAICELNRIENPDDIYFGQKILLP